LEALGTKEPVCDHSRPHQDRILTVTFYPIGGEGQRVSKSEISISRAQVDGVFQAVLADANSPGVERNHNGCWVKEFPLFSNSNSACGRKGDFKFYSMCSLPFLALLCRFWFARHRYWSPDTHALESTTWQWALHAREQSPEAPLPGERPRAVRCSTPEEVPGRHSAFPDTTLRSQLVG
jgi:hypothetical protein